MENNKLIAEFMGMIVSNWQDYDSTIHTNVDADLLYHESWDWLMPVVEKVLHTMNGRDLYAIIHENLLMALTEVNIEATYKAVIEFIKLYNNEDNQPL